MRRGIYRCSCGRLTTERFKLCHHTTRYGHMTTGLTSFKPLNPTRLMTTLRKVLKDDE